MSQKLSLQQKLLQKLSPQQIQLIQLLEIPTVELEQRIKKELEENPVLELDEGSDNDFERDETDDALNSDEFTLEDYVDSDDIPDYKLRSNNYSADDNHTESVLSQHMSLRENMIKQIHLLNLDDEDAKIAEYLIGNLDEDGYLRRDIYSISDDLAFNLNLDVSEEVLSRLLKQIQSLDPAGVGAQNLQECLLIQLRRKKYTKAHETADLILSKHFEALSHRSYNKIQKIMQLSEEELKAALDEIHKLNPKPGSTGSTGETKNYLAIVPDFILEYQDGEMILSMNDQNVPKLRVNEQYIEMMNDLQTQKRESDAQTTLQFVKQNAENAKWFVDAIKARKMTLLHCMTIILDYQKEYFENGDVSKLRPMILKDIAELTQLDISTISRMRQSKYIQTNFGIISLKSLFSEGVEEENGKVNSNKVIMQAIADIIEGEDKSKPLTDEKITQLVNEKNFTITRRTVSKYREQLGIPVARLRRQL